MILSLFAFIAWVAIIIFMLTPRYLSKIENILVFFGLSMISVNLFTIPDLNLKLIQHSNNPEMFISLCLYRNIILPLCLLIFVNYFAFMRTTFNKIGITAVILLVLYLIEKLTIWTGVREYTGWNDVLTICVLVVIISLSTILAKVIKRIP